MSKTNGESVKNNHRRMLRRLEYALLALIAAGLITVGVSCIALQNAFRDGGYSERWEDGVDGTTLRDVAYGSRPWEIMNVYVPKTLDESKVKGAILFIHGGAWVGGSRSEQQGFARFMATNSARTKKKRIRPSRFVTRSTWRSRSS